MLRLGFEIDSLPPLADTSKRQRRVGFVGFREERVCQRFKAGYKFGLRLLARF